MWFIVKKHVFTLFNAVNLILAAMIVATGDYKNMFFVVIALANTLISIINELHAKKIVDNLRLTAEQKPRVKRGDKVVQIPASKVKTGDQIVLSLGDQVLFDSKILSGSVEVNESFITGEQENIEKHENDTLTSGSFITSGTAITEVIHIGDDNFINKLTKDAKQIKTANSKLFTFLNKVIRNISIALIPIGILLFFGRLRAETDLASATTSTVAALVSMIPEGLVLLTSSALALSSIRLSKKKVLVNDLYSIETLARVDTICLDKTGTLTTGKMKVKDIIPSGNSSEMALINALELIFAHLPADNATSEALARKFARTPKNKPTEQKQVKVIPFSSERKYSGVSVRGIEYLLGALEFLSKNPEYRAEESKLTGIYRTLAVIKQKNGDDELLGFVRLEDEIRKTAPKIIDYFEKNDIDVKIISGDDQKNVVDISRKTGVKDLRAIDLSATDHKNYASLVKNYSIFTRVTPAEKKSLIEALKKQGRTVAMTGDGVNDILAMKSADCSLAIGAGSDAARRSAKFVLLTSDFTSIPDIINEGRQTINNLERSATLFLAKTVYASILSVLYAFLPLTYPYTPVEMTFLNFIIIGFPGAVLALEKNTTRVKDRFANNVAEYSFPAGLAIAISMVVLSIINETYNFASAELTTISFFTTFIIGLLLIYVISRPLNRFRALNLIGIIVLTALLYSFTRVRTFFEFANLSYPTALTLAIVIAVAIGVFVLVRLSVVCYNKRHENPRHRN